MILAQLELDLAMFRDGGGSGGAWRFLADPRFWAVAVTVIGAAAAMLAIADLIRRDHAAGGPTARMLAGSLGLDRRDLRLLSFLARQGEFPSAACLMISRGCFERAAERAPLGPGDPAIMQLRGRLFDEFDDDDDPLERVHSGDEWL